MGYHLISSNFSFMTPKNAADYKNNGRYVLSILYFNLKIGRCNRTDVSTYYCFYNESDKG